MTEMNDGPRMSDYECIDPTLGDQIWRLEDPATATDLRTQLATHVRYCAACRLRRSLVEEVSGGLREGRLSLRVPVRHPAWTMWTTRVGALAAAACLALIFVLPPRLATDGLVMRGDDEPRIIDPLAGTVIADHTPTIRWTAIPRATAYRVSVREIGGSYAWHTETSQNDAAVPADAPLPASARLRVTVEPVPTHLAPAGGLQASFRSGSWREFIGFRVMAAPPLVLVVAVGGMLTTMVGILTPRRRHT